MGSQRTYTFPRDFVFPDLCLKCGSRESILRRPIVYRYTSVRSVFPVANLIVPAKNHEVSVAVPVCAACDARHRTTFKIMAGVWAVPVSCVAVALIGRHYGMRMDVAGFLAMVGGGAVLVVGVAHLAFASRRLLPGVARIDDKTITLGNLGRRAVEQLPRFPGSTAW
jgi:hypothetical protein